MSQVIKNQRNQLLIEGLTKARRWALHSGLMTEGEMFQKKHLDKWPEYKKLNARQGKLLHDKLEEISSHSKQSLLW